MKVKTFDKSDSEQQKFGISTKGVGNWQPYSQPFRYKCGFCDNAVSSSNGMSDFSKSNKIMFCPDCNAPTIFSNNTQFPKGVDSNLPKNLPENIAKIYNEATSAISVAAYTAVVLLCRKILMHVSVELGAKAGEYFAVYVEFLMKNNFIPPNGKTWVDKIRLSGNEANHTINIFNEKQAEDILKLTKFLLNYNYELIEKE